MVGRSLGAGASEEHEGSVRVEPDAKDLAVVREKTAETLVEFDLVRLEVEEPEGLVFDENQVGELEKVAELGSGGSEERRQKRTEK